MLFLYMNSHPDTIPMLMQALSVMVYIAYIIVIPIPGSFEIQTLHDSGYSVCV